MQAIRVHHFGGLDSLVAEDVPRPAPGDGEVLLRVKAAGVGPWDALDQVRAERPSSATSVDARVRRGRACRARRCRGLAVQGWRCGVRRNERPFTGGYAEYAVASATKLAKMPQRMGFIDAASVPVVACTAWQMVFEYGAVDATKRVLVHGAAGNVGAYAVQLARRVAHEVVATAFSDDVAYVQTLGADRVIDVQTSRFEEVLTDVDVVLDTIGGDTQDRSFAVLKPGGVLVSAVSRARSGESCSPRRTGPVLPRRGLIAAPRTNCGPDRSRRTDHERRRCAAAFCCPPRPRNARRQAAQARKDRSDRRRVSMTSTLQSRDIGHSPREDQHVSNPVPDRRAAALRSCWPKPLGADRVARLSCL